MVVVILGGKGADGIACASQFQSDRISQNVKRRVERRSSIPGSGSGRERKAPLTIRRQISFQADIQLREFNDGTGHRDSLVWWASAVVWSRHRGLHIEKGVTEPAFIVRALGTLLPTSTRPGTPAQRLCIPVGESSVGNFAVVTTRYIGFSQEQNKIGSQAVGKRRLS